MAAGTVRNAQILGIAHELHDEDRRPFGVQLPPCGSQRKPKSGPGIAMLVGKNLMQSPGRQREKLWSGYPGLA